MRNAVAVLVTVGLALALAGCQWRTLSVSTLDPVYFGSYSSMQEDMADSIGTVEGFYAHEKEEGVHVEGRTSSFGAGGGREDELRLIESAIAEALDGKPDRFVSDVEMRIQTRTGFSGWSLLVWIVGESIVKDSEGADFDAELDESFIIKATVREVKSEEAPNE